KFRFGKPGVDAEDVDFSACYELDRYLTPDSGTEATQAFMLNRYPTLKSFCYLQDVGKIQRACEVAQQCWSDANKVLKNGIKTTSCAEYFWDAGQQDMSLRFIDCKENKPPFKDDDTFYTLTGEVSDECTADAIQTVCANIW